VDSTSGEVQSLIDSIAIQAGQEKLRQVAQQNLEAVRNAGAGCNTGYNPGVDAGNNAGVNAGGSAEVNAGGNIPHDRELISDIWMHSMSPARNAGVTPAQLHLDITRQCPIDDNAFQAEITLLYDSSVNIHGGEIPGGPLWFSLGENPRSKVRACARNDKLWTVSAGPSGAFGAFLASGASIMSGASSASSTSSAGHVTYPGKDIEYIRKTLLHLFNPEIRQSSSRVIILGPNWNRDPWSEVDEVDKPDKWNRPILLVIPEQIEGGKAGISAFLGVWLVKHVQKRRNIVRFLLLAPDAQGLYTDRELLHSARCSFLCCREGWGTDATYRALHQDFDRPLRQTLSQRFNRFAILQKWNFQSPQNCTFDIEKISHQRQETPGRVDISASMEIPGRVEATILSNLFDRAEFNAYVLQRAKDSDFVGSLMDDLMEPPPPTAGNAIPFLGETKTYELILEIASQGDIVLNIDGAWIGRRAEDISDDGALHYIKHKAFRSGQEMRRIQLGLPGALGGGTITAPPGTSGSSATAAGGHPSGTAAGGYSPVSPLPGNGLGPQPYPPQGAPTAGGIVNDGSGSQGGSTTIVTPAWTPASPIQAGSGTSSVPGSIPGSVPSSGSGSGAGAGTGTGTGSASVPGAGEGTGTGATIEIIAQTRRADEPSSGINLSGCFEKWGVPSSQAIDSAKIEFSGLTAQQIKQILQRIPSAFKAIIEITYKKEGE